MGILQQIQTELLDPDVPLSSVLRKAKVLAYQLQSEELKSWMSQELDGYSTDSLLPDYRILKTICVGTWTNGVWTYSNYGVPLMKIKDEELEEILTVYRVYSGARTVEQYAMDKDLNYFLSTDIMGWVNYYVSENDYGFTAIKYALGPQQFEQILDTVRNRLLDFVLALDSNWHVEEESPPHDAVRDMVSFIIYNNPQGGNVSVFDQRGQQVNYQYNSAGNINIKAGQGRDEFIAELEKLRAEVERAKEAKAIDQDVAVEAEYHLLQATKEAKKEEPNKGSFLEHVGKAKALLEDAAAAAGLVAALMKAAEVAQRVF